MAETSSSAISPLSGGYLLIVLTEPHSEQHKQILLEQLAKGLASWDSVGTQIDIESELRNIAAQCPHGEEVRNGEKLIQLASDSLVTEILIHPQLSTLKQCMRNLLASFTRHRHVIHAGYTLSGPGSWILQDGTYEFTDFLHMVRDVDIQRIYRAYESSITMDLHCADEGQWTSEQINQEPAIKAAKISVNPAGQLSTTDSGQDAINAFVRYISDVLPAVTLDHLLEPSDVVGNIRFSHPTLYVFPGGQGDSALFGISGFNILVDGGFGRKPCFWDFTRHLDRLDAVVMTRSNASSLSGLTGAICRKASSPVYPQVGHIFCNLPDNDGLDDNSSTESSDSLTLHLNDLCRAMSAGLGALQLKAQPIYRTASLEPINLYHKVGHGTLDMFIISPSADSADVKELMRLWRSGDPASAYRTVKMGGKEFRIPLLDMVSVCALLVWQPADPSEQVTRLLFPGSAPQHKILEGLEKFKRLEFLKSPTWTGKETVATTPTSTTSQPKSPVKIKTSPRHTASEPVAIKSVAKPASKEVKPKSVENNKEVDAKTASRPASKIKAEALTSSSRTSSTEIRAKKTEAKPATPLIKSVTTSTAKKDATLSNGEINKSSQAAVPKIKKDVANMKMVEARVHSFKSPASLKRAEENNKTRKTPADDKEMKDRVQRSQSQSREKRSASAVRGVDDRVKLVKKTATESPASPAKVASKSALATKAPKPKEIKPAVTESKVKEVVKKPAPKPKAPVKESPKPAQSKAPSSSTTTTSTPSAKAVKRPVKAAVAAVAAAVVADPAPAEEAVAAVEESFNAQEAPQAASSPKHGAQDDGSVGQQGAEDGSIMATIEDQIVVETEDNPSTEQEPQAVELENEAEEEQVKEEEDPAAVEAQVVDPDEAESAELDQETGDQDESAEPEEAGDEVAESEEVETADTTGLEESVETEDAENVATDETTTTFVDAPAETAEPDEEESGADETKEKSADDQTVEQEEVEEVVEEEVVEEEVVEEEVVEEESAKDQEVDVEEEQVHQEEDNQEVETKEAEEEEEQPEEEQPEEEHGQTLDEENVAAEIEPSDGQDLDTSLEPEKDDVPVQEEEVEEETQPAVFSASSESSRRQTSPQPAISGHEMTSQVDADDDSIHQQDDDQVEENADGKEEPEDFSAQAESSPVLQQDVPAADPVDDQATEKVDIQVDHNDITSSSDAGQDDKPNAEDAESAGRHDEALSSLSSFSDQATTPVLDRSSANLHEEEQQLSSMESQPESHQLIQKSDAHQSESSPPTAVQQTADDADEASGEVEEEFKAQVVHRPVPVSDPSDDVAGIISPVSTPVKSPVKEIPAPRPLVLEQEDDDGEEVQEEEFHQEIKNKELAVPITPTEVQSPPEFQPADSQHPSSQSQQSEVMSPKNEESTQPLSKEDQTDLFRATIDVQYAGLFDAKSDSVKEDEKKSSETKSEEHLTVEQVKESKSDDKPVETKQKEESVEDVVEEKVSKVDSKPVESQKVVEDIATQSEEETETQIVEESEIEKTLKNILTEAVNITMDIKSSVESMDVKEENKSRKSSAGDVQLPADIKSVDSPKVEETEESKQVDKMDDPLLHPSEDVVGEAKESEEEVLKFEATAETIETEMIKSQIHDVKESKPVDSDVEEEVVEEVLKVGIELVQSEKLVSAIQLSNNETNVQVDHQVEEEIESTEIDFEESQPSMDRSKMDDEDQEDVKEMKSAQVEVEHVDEKEMKEDIKDVKEEIKSVKKEVEHDVKEEETKHVDTELKQDTKEEILPTDVEQDVKEVKEVKAEMKDVKEDVEIVSEQVPSSPFLAEKEVFGLNLVVSTQVDEPVVKELEIKSVESKKTEEPAVDKSLPDLSLEVTLKASDIVVPAEQEEEEVVEEVMEIKASTVQSVPKTPESLVQELAKSGSDKSVAQKVNEPETLESDEEIPPQFELIEKSSQSQAEVNIPSEPLKIDIAPLKLESDVSLPSMTTLEKEDVKFEATFLDTEIKSTSSFSVNEPTKEDVTSRPTFVAPVTASSPIDGPEIIKESSVFPELFEKKEIDEVTTKSPIDSVSFEIKESTTEVRESTEIVATSSSALYEAEVPASPKSKMDGVKDFFKGIKDAVKDAVKDVVEDIKMNKDIKDDKETVKDIKDAKDAVKDVKNEKDVVKDVVKDVKDEKDVVKDVETEKDVVTDVKIEKDVVEDVKADKDANKDVVKDVKVEKDAVKDLKDEKDAIKDTAEDIITDVKSDKDAVKDVVKDIVQDVKDDKDVVKDIVKDTVQDVKDDKDAVKDVVKDIVQDVKGDKNAVKDVVKDIVQDVKDDKDAAKDVVQDVKDDKDAVKDIVKDVVQDVQVDNAAVKEAVKDVLEDVVHDVAKDVKCEKDAVKDIVQDIAKEIVKDAKDDKEIAKDAVKDVKEEKDQKDTVKDIKDVVTDVVKDVKDFFHGNVAKDVEEPALEIKTAPLTEASPKQDSNKSASFVAESEMIPQATFQLKCDPLVNLPTIDLVSSCKTVESQVEPVKSANVDVTKAEIKEKTEQLKPDVIDYANVSGSSSASVSPKTPLSPNIARRPLEVETAKVDSSLVTGPARFEDDMSNLSQPCSLESTPSLSGIEKHEEEETTTLSLTPNISYLAGYEGVTVSANSKLSTIESSDGEVDGAQHPSLDSNWSSKTFDKLTTTDSSRLQPEESAFSSGPSSWDEREPAARPYYMVSESMSDRSATSSITSHMTDDDYPARKLDQPSLVSLVEPLSADSNKKELAPVSPVPSSPFSTDRSSSHGDFEANKDSLSSIQTSASSDYHLETKVDDSTSALSSTRSDYSDRSGSSVDPLGKQQQLEQRSLTPRSDISTASETTTTITTTTQLIQPGQQTAIEVKASKVELADPKVAPHNIWLKEKDTASSPNPFSDQYGDDDSDHPVEHASSALYYQPEQQQHSSDVESDRHSQSSVPVAEYTDEYYAQHLAYMEESRKSSQQVSDPDAETYLYESEQDEHDQQFHPYSTKYSDSYDEGDNYPPEEAINQDYRNQQQQIGDHQNGNSYHYYQSNESATTGVNLGHLHDQNQEAYEDMNRNDRTPSRDIQHPYVAADTESSFNPTSRLDITSASTSSTSSTRDDRALPQTSPLPSPQLQQHSPQAPQHSQQQHEETLASWGKPLGLPTPVAPVVFASNGSGLTDKKSSNGSPLKRPASTANGNNKTADKTTNGTSSSTPFYVDLAYIPHHSDPRYSDVEFFRRVRARHYVLSSLEPSAQVLDALLEGKQSWTGDDKDLDVTIIPTYDSDALAVWVSANEDLLARNRIDLAPSASRCTINLQDHETSCSAYRLEF